MNYMWQKLIICLSIIVVAYADDDNDIGMTSEELADALEPFAENCDPKPDREHIKQLIKNDEDPHYHSKCLRHCLMREFGVIDDGETKMNIDKAVEMLSVMFSEGQDDLADIVEQCNGKNQGVTEKCENAHKHGMCILNELRDRGYKVPQVGK